MEDWNQIRRNPSFMAYSTPFLVIFTLEAMLKMAALGEKENFFCRLGIEAYFQSRWNVFDFVILFFGWIGSLFVFTYGRTTTTLRVFRLFRAIRAFRLFSAIKSLLMRSFMELATCFSWCSCSIAAYTCSRLLGNRFSQCDALSMHAA